MQLSLMQASILFELQAVLAWSWGSFYSNPPLAKSSSLYGRCKCFTLESFKFSPTDGQLQMTDVQQSL